MINNAGETENHAWELVRERDNDFQKNDERSSKRHTPDQEELSELVKESEKKGVSNDEADTLLDWADECNYPNRNYRGKDH